MAVTSYIQGHDAATLRSHQSRNAESQADYLLPYIKADSHILDVGCGPGTITCGLAKYAPQGKVLGVDYSEEVVEKARKEARERGVENVSFQAGSAHELPFEDESFDVVHCHAVLVHLPDALSALKEMRRVCKAGGYVAAREPDWDTCVIHPYSTAIERWKAVQAQLKRSEGAEPNAGRHLAEWAFASGFDVDKVQVTSNVLQYFGKEHRKFWGELYVKRMDTELKNRAVKAGLATSEEIDEWAKAYLDWSKAEAGIWAMMHMRLLCQK